MELRILIKNTSYLVTTKVVKFGVGLIRSKLIAIFLGTIGTGIISQLTTIIQQMSTFTLMTVNDGLVKQIAEERHNEGFKSKLAYLIKSYVIIISLLTIICIPIVAIFSKKITIYVFGDIKYYDYFIIGLISFPVLIVNSVSFALLKSHKEIKYIARSELLVILFNIIIFVPLIYFWGITGAVIYVPLSLISILVVNNYFARKKVLSRYSLLNKDIFNAKVNKTVIKELFVFAGIGLTAGTSIVISEIATRSVVVTTLGLAQIGLYSPLIAWTGLFTGFIMPSVSTYLYPRLSEAKSNIEIRGILNDVLRLVSFLMIPILFLSIPLRYQIIPIFYSKDFIEAGNYLPWHFLGILFYLWMHSLALVLTPTGRIKTYGVLVIIMSLINFFVVYLSVPIYGLYGWLLKFIISPVLFFGFYLLYLKKEIRFMIEIKNRILMLYAFIVPLILIAVDIFLTSNYWINLVIGFFFTSLSFFLLTSNERNYLLKKIKMK